MPDFKDLENVKAVLLLVLPGLLFIWARGKFITGRMPAMAEMVVPYFALSTAYWILAYPATKWFLGDDYTKVYPNFIWFASIYLIPLALGVLAGGIARGELLPKWVAGLIGLEPVHPAPSAWDRLFGVPTRHLMRIRLTDDTIIAGVYAKGSFASSDGSYRDIYIKNTFKLDEHGKPIPSDTYPAAYVPADKIKFIEFF